ncbi:hypothetical protein E2562_025211 [Oryza meyeriana var. granulata]|uniref:RING-type domain-containing protein n=1 Tax=Oryza meyeriana var. granulata TaxID=110450 RepID=A0A6G1E3X1_9ORYZ|nr:hypothetical protein E2562_025211 [Oryza meyeriana var. granulata]
MDMDWDLFMRGLVCLGLVVMGGSLLVIVVVEAVLCFRRWRRRRDEAMSLEQLLAGTPDVPAPSGHEDEEEGSSPPWCIICMAAQEDGERWLELPDCGHVFHRDCVATWLRDHKNSTCPLCRASILD